MDFFKILNGGIGVSMSNFDRLWAKKFSGWPETELTGLLPLTFLAEGSALTDYRIYGTSEGAGVQTENLFDPATTNFNHRVDGNGNIIYDSRNDCSDYIEVESATAYSQNNDNDYISEYDANKGFVKRTTSQAGRFTTSNTTKYIITSFGKNAYTNYMVVKGWSFPPQYIPHGYKIPILNTSGVTENLWDGELEQGSFNSSGEEAASTARIRSDYIYIQNSDNYTIKLTGAEGVVVYVYDANKSFLSAESTMGWRTCPFTREIEANRYVRFAFAKSSSGTFEEIVPSDVSNIMLTEGSTAPDHYIPHRYESNYDLFIGDSKLGEEEYVDYGEQKIYKDVSGTLTPTDPPAPFPALSTYQGENTLSSEETVGEVTIKGRIKEAP